MEKDRLDEILDDLQTTWEDMHAQKKNIVTRLHGKGAGIRSTQIAALIQMLLDLGIIK